MLGGFLLAWAPSFLGAKVKKAKAYIEDYFPEKCRVLQKDGKFDPLEQRLFSFESPEQVLNIFDKLFTHGPRFIQTHTCYEYSKRNDRFNHGRQFRNRF